MRRDQGMVLVMALLFVSMIALLVIQLVEYGLLETRANTNARYEFIAFQAAESGLLIEESMIQGEKIQIPPFKAKITHHSKLLSTDVCNKKRYKIIASANYRGAEITLMSNYEWLSNTKNLLCKKEVGGRRVYWSVA